ncbi:MAG: HdeD family acid-resistance protein [Rhodoplanes sp.]|nr:HdeD family acid-resistance protein [Rhodoplanes sp.]
MPDTAPAPTPPFARPTLHMLAGRWWLVLLRGIVAILFGVVAFAWPGLTLVTLVVFYGAFAFADGVLAIGGAIAGKGPTSARWWLVLSGVLGLAVGAIAFVAPGAVAVALLIFIAAWSIALGVMQIVAAIQLRKEIEHEWLLILAGVVSVLFGGLLLSQPLAGALAVVWMIAAYAIIEGIVYIAWAFRLKAWRDKKAAGAAVAA